MVMKLWIIIVFELLLQKFEAIRFLEFLVYIQLYSRTEVVWMLQALVLDARHLYLPWKSGMYELDMGWMPDISAKHLDISAAKEILIKCCCIM